MNHLHTVVVSPAATAPCLELYQTY